MAKGPKITIRSLFDATGVNAAINSINALNTQVNKISRGFNNFMGLMGGAAFGYQIANFMKSSLDSFAKQEQASSKLQAALRNVGITSKEVSRDYGEFAAQIQRTTTVSDETTLEMMGLLTTFGLVGDKAKEAYGAALNLSKGLGMDLNTAVMLVGKAAMGSTGQLARYGIVIDTSLPKAQRFEAVLNQLNSRFGGMAQAEIKTYAGQVAQLANTYDDLKESVGEQLLPVMVYWMSVLDKLLKKTESLIPKTYDMSAAQAGLKIITASLAAEYQKGANADNARIERLKRLQAAAAGNLKAEKERLAVEAQSQISKVKPSGMVDEAEAERLKAVQTALKNFEAQMLTERGQAYLLFFEQGKIASEMFYISQATSSEDAKQREKTSLQRLANDYLAASKTFAGGFKQAFNEIGQAGTNWNQLAGGLMNGFTSNFAAGFKNAMDTAEGFFDFVDNGIKALFDSILQAFEDLLAQLVAKAALYGILNLFSGGAFGGITGGLFDFLGFFSKGGPVPGAPGSSGVAVLHAGEYVLPASDVQAITSGRTTPGNVLSRNGLASSSTGSGSAFQQTIHVSVSGGINSELDVQKVAGALADAARRGAGWAVDAAATVTKVGNSQSKRTTT